jgi:hypothetical protein
MKASAGTSDLGRHRLRMSSSDGVLDERCRWWRTCSLCRRLCNSHGGRMTSMQHAQVMHDLLGTPTNWWTAHATGRTRWRIRRQRRHGATVYAMSARQSVYERAAIVGLLESSGMMLSYVTGLPAGEVGPTELPRSALGHLAEGYRRLRAGESLMMVMPSQHDTDQLPVGAVVLARRSGRPLAIAAVSLRMRNQLRTEVQITTVLQDDCRSIEDETIGLLNQLDTMFR